jgi:hypothetical protein
MSDEFDKKLREKLSEADIPFEPESWQKMEQKLDALNNGSSRRRIFWWWLAPLLLLLLGTGAYLWWQPTASDGGLQAPSEKISEQQSPDRSPAKDSFHQEQSSPSQTIAQQEQQQTPAPGSITIPRETTVIKDKKAVPEQGHPAVNKPAAPPPGVGPHQPSSAPALIYPQQQREATKAAVKKEKAGNTADSNNNIPQLPPAAMPQPEEKKIASKSGDSSNSPVKKPVKETEKESKEKDTPPKRKGFSIGIMLGPVLNVAPSMQYGRIGLDAGVLLNYHINNRWSVTSGAIYSIKPYGGTLSDYGVSKKWRPPYNPDYAIKHIDANCNVLDVPLNINYTFMDKSKYTLSATAGVSSYFMLKEKYDYILQNAYPQKRELTNENQHYAALLNLAFTYQFPVSRRMSLGIQPYAKIPFRGVGFGEVRLYSTGVAVQVNFNSFRRIP